MLTQRHEEKSTPACSGLVGRGAGGWRRKKERPPPALWLLFLYVFFLPLGLPYVNWASQQCCLFYLKSSLWSSDLPLFCFHRLFSFLSFNYRLSGLLFPILTNYLTFSSTSALHISGQTIGASALVLPKNIQG